jgi:NAD(P)-dependent dehydrogenase (short-subunit alcohol dehydrogenase family)
VVYETLKTAVIGLTRSLAVDYRDSFPFFERQYPIRRAGTPLDIANAVVFLCSNEASFITGQALVVDGGLTIQLQEDLGVNLAHYIQERPETWLPF